MNENPILPKDVMKMLSFNLYVSKHKIVFTGLIAFLIGGSLGFALWQLGGTYSPSPLPETWNNYSLQRFSSYKDLKDFLMKSSQGLPIYPRDIVFSIEAGETNTADYSTTNIQVAGVDEIDIVKNDGEFLYIVSGKSVFIVRAYPPESTKVLYRLDYAETIYGIYVSSNKLILFQGGYDPYGIVYRESSAIPGYYEAPRTSIKIYDISNRTAPTLDQNITMDGYYLSSRMIGDYVYAVINKPAYVSNDEVALPLLYYNDLRIEVNASDIYYINVSDYYYTFTDIVAVNVQKEDEVPTRETYLLGTSSNLYVSQENIYITATVGIDSTTIHKINIEDGEITYVAHGNVTGHVLNQFSMDEYDGFFRVATTRSEIWGDGVITTKSYIWGEGSPSQSNIYVLNASLAVIGKLEGLAPGESIYSARFIGDRCYLVTYVKIDPLFVIDLQDPENPQVLGELEVPGYSDYLHPYDETHLIGVGKETLPAVEGDFSWYQGVKISLFDVTNVSNPTETWKFVIGDRGTDSPVLSDHKAFLFSKQKNLLVLPILLAEIDESDYPEGVPPYAYGDYVWQGVYVFNISVESGLVLIGRITHMENSTDLVNSGYYFDSPYAVKRSLYINNVLYTISDKMIKMNGLDYLEDIAEVELP